MLECPNDGAPLQRPPEELQKNPKIEDVVQVTTNEMTAVVDLEKLEAIRLKEEAQKKAAKAALDPEATGTFFRAEEAQTQSSSLGNDVSSRLFSEEHSAVTQVNEPEIYSEPTEISLPNLRVENNPTDSEEQKSTDNSVLKYKVTIGIAGFVCLAGLFLFFNPKPSEGSDATLLVTTVPTGAEVWVDSQLKGKSPIQCPNSRVLRSRDQTKRIPPLSRCY